jgi:hypothetical protein
MSARRILGDLPIDGVFFLLIGGRGPFGPVARIDFRVVGRRLGSCRDHGDEQGAGDGERENDAPVAVLMQTLLFRDDGLSL